jgi:hypothetical protein
MTISYPDNQVRSVHVHKPLTDSLSVRRPGVSPALSPIPVVIAAETRNKPDAAVRRHGRAYLLGLLSHAEREDSWWLAESEARRAGDRA